MEDAAEKSAPTRPRGWLGVVAFALSLLVLAGTVASLLVINRVPASVLGAAIDSYDDNKVTEAGRAILDHVAMQVGWVFLIGTVLGIIAIVIASAALRGRARSARTGTFAGLAIVAALVTPLVFLVISGGTLLAASDPHN